MPTLAHCLARFATQAAGQPVISIDTKKKELVGSYKNAGSDYRPEGRPEQVNVHDFVDKALGKVAPYGVYYQPPLTHSSWVNGGWYARGVGGAAARQIKTHTNRR